MGAPGAAQPAKSSLRRLRLRRRSGFAAAPSSVIEIEFANGTRLRITGAIEAATVSALIKALAKGSGRR